MRLTTFDKQLLNVIQTGLPLTTEPFADIARQLGCDENMVFERLALLKEQGVIRRLGAFFDAESLGYRGRLVAVKASKECLPTVAAAINAWPEVTHNDERDNEYNLWFTAQATDDASIVALMDRVGEMTGVEEIISMPTGKRYKVNLKFCLE
jgi:DNA-binding Lrp family transcriptional regulator